MVPHSDNQYRVLEMERQRLLDRARREHLGDLAVAGRADAVAPRPNVALALSALGRRLAAAIDQVVLPLVWPRLVASSQAARLPTGEGGRPGEDPVVVATTAAT